jgi:small subunit ribosomal protein S17
MADETPDNEQTEPVADEAAVEAPAADAEAPAAEHAASATASKRDSREERARREHVARSQRPARTAEERDAERRQVRAAKAVARRRRREQEKSKRAAAGPGTGTPPAEPTPSSPQTRIGTVVSAKPDKTIVVRIDLARRHRKYEKIVRSTSKLHVHDEANDANEGDRVRVLECRPLSRTKRWKLVEVLERAK